MADAIQIGDLADITIKGVRIVEQFADGSVAYADEHGHRYPMPPQAAVTRVASADWPPQIGDVWEGYDHGIWHARRHDGFPGVVLLDVRDLEPDTGSYFPDAFLEANGVVPKLLFRVGAAQVTRVREVIGDLHEQAPTNPDPSFCREGCPGCIAKAALDQNAGNSAEQVEALQDAAANMHEEFYSPAAPAHLQGGGCRDNCPGCRIEAALNGQDGGEGRG